MPHSPHPDADSPQSTASHPASLGAAGGSSFVTLAPAGSSSHPVNPNTDDHPTVITSNRAVDPGILIAPGGRLGHYEVIESVGAGGMAAVLKARDLELGRIVALKILPPHMARDPENVARFKQEARAAARLDHDNIARVFFCGEDQNLHFIAFEYVEGNNLRVLIDQRKTIPPGECISYMAQTAAGLAHAAARGVVHRDVKPSNIVISPDGKAKIVDMGLARSLGGQSVNGGVTQSGITLGTFDYISPEQALDPRRADVRSDIYSLGCAFYHALTGRPPVPEGTAAKKLQAHQNDPVIDPRVLNPAVPDELAAVLSKMMAKDPAKRYQTPAELISDLAIIAARLNLTLEGVAVDSTSSHPRSVLAGRSFDEPMRIPFGWVLAFGGIAIAVAVFIATTTRTTDPNASTLPPFHSTSLGSNGKSNTPPELAPTPTPVTTTRRVVADVTASDADALAQYLQEPGVTTIQLTKGVVYDLTQQIRGLVVSGKSVTILGVPGPSAPTIRIASAPADRDRFDGKYPGTLSFTRAESVTVEGVRFEIADSTGTDFQLEDPVGLAIVETPRVKIVGCRFDNDPELRASAVVGLSVFRDNKDTAAEVTLSHCFFAVKRAVGVRLSGRVKAIVEESGFAPHLAALELLGNRVLAAEGLTTDLPGGEVRLSHCSFLLDQKGAAISAEDGGRWNITAGYSVFASPPPPTEPVDGMTMMMDPMERRPAVLRVLSDRHDFDVRFTGEPGDANAYFHVDPLSYANRGYTFDECRQQWQPTPVMTDAAGEMLRYAPWESTDPVADVFNRDTREPWRALRLRTTFRPIQIPNSEDKLLGMRLRPTELLRDTGRFLLYNDWPPPTHADVALNSGEKVWYPKPPEDERGRLPRHHFATLAEAIADLKSGDVLLIRHNGPIAVPPTIFDRPKLQITIRPFPDSAPVLIPTGLERTDSSLFRIEEGDITFERLPFELRGRTDEFAEVRMRSAITVAGTARCTLRECSVTLDETSTEKLSAVTIARTVDGSAITSRRPSVVVENSFVRGKGRGVWVKAARPFYLDVNNSVVALAGSLLTVEPPDRTHPANATSQVVFTRITAALTQSVLDLRTGQTLGTPAWIPVDVSARQCLFASVGMPAPLVSVSGAGESLEPDRFLTWRKAGLANWYQRRPADTVFLDIIAIDEAVGQKTLTSAGWFDFTGENAKESLASVEFADQPLSTRALLTLKPAALTVSDVDISGAATDDAGANIGQVAKPPTIPEATPTAKDTENRR